MAEAERLGTIVKRTLAQYTDPRWQKKRLQIFQRDKWTCQRCANTESELHVHHLFYLNKNMQAWECPDELLVTLCKQCHQQETDLQKQIDQLLLDAFKKHDIQLLKPIIEQKSQTIGGQVQLEQALWNVISSYLI